MARYYSLQFVFLLCFVFISGNGSSHWNSVPILIPSTNLNGSNCPSQNVINEQLGNIKNILSKQFGHSPPCSCGSAGNWTRVAYLNMTDQAQSCPQNWSLTTFPVRGCGRRSLTGASCDSVHYSVRNFTYSKVCGQINAFQKDISGAFFNSIGRSAITLERSYVSGVSLTHGADGSRKHIWTFAGAIYEDSRHPNLSLDHKCPCTDSNTSWPYDVPSYVGSDYFCETGKKTALVDSGITYAGDPLWDGEGCGPASTCCSFNSPPWFCKSLPQPTSDDLEMRLCYTSPVAHENKFISFIDIYVQ